MKDIDFGFRNEYSIDLADTVSLYVKNPNAYKESECYCNAYKVLDGIKQNNDSDKIVYGYVLSTDGERKVAVRHSWNELDGRRIDVTMMANGENLFSVLGYRYLPIDKYTLNGYRTLMLKYDLYGLPETKKETVYIKRLKDKGFEVLG